MTRSDAELEKLYRRLTAKERARLEIAGWREDREPDPLLRRLTPDSQVREINQYLLGAERANAIVGAMVLWLGQRVETLEVRHGLVAALRLRQMLADEVVMALQLDLPEPITTAEHERRLAEQRAERIPIGEAAWLLVDSELDDEEMVAEQARQEARIRAAAKQGELAVERGKVRCGELMDWAEREVTVVPEWGLEMQVLPAGHEEYVARVNRFREQLFAAVAPARAPAVEDAPDWEHLIADMVEAIVAGLRESWGVFLALDAAMESAAEGLDGEPVLHPETMLQLEDVRKRILWKVEQLVEEGVEVELPGEPEAEFLRMLQNRIG